MITSRKRTAFLKLAEGFLGIVILILTSLYEVSLEQLEATGQQILASHFNPFYAAALFYSVGLTWLLANLRSPEPGKLVRKNNIFLAILYFTVGTLFLFDRLDWLTELLAVSCILLDVLARRIIAFVKNRSLRKGIFLAIHVLVLVTIFIIYLAVRNMFPFSVVFLYIGIYLGFRSLLRVVILSFSQIQFRILRKILRKTYAAEIIFGLLLLVFSFSVIFCLMDEAFTSYGDALWYSFAIVTTIGFGDFAATNFITRTLSVVLGIYGIIVVALVTSIIVNFYSETKDTKGEDDEDEDEDDGDNRNSSGPAENNKNPSTS